MCFVGPLTLLSCKHFLSFSLYVKQSEMLAYLTNNGSFSLLNACKTFKMPFWKVTLKCSVLIDPFGKF